MMVGALRLAIIVSVLAVGGCERMKGGSTTQVNPAEIPSYQTLSRIPLGAPPGEPVSLAGQITNPLAGDAAAVQEGKALFASMNCVYCHGAQASGLIGPSLNDQGWRYGGAPAELFKSIAEGRPKGMPAWGARLPPDQIWKLVAYLESLGGASPPASPQLLAQGLSQPSTTGPELAGQRQSDTAHNSLMGAQKGRPR